MAASYGRICHDAQVALMASAVAIAAVCVRCVAVYWRFIGVLCYLLRVHAAYNTLCATLSLIVAGDAHG